MVDGINLEDGLTEDDLRKLVVWAEIQEMLARGLVVAVYYNDSAPKNLPNLKKIVLTYKGKVALGRIKTPKAKEPQSGRWYNKRTLQTYNYKGDERFGLVLVGVKGEKATHRILAENLAEY